ncbi:hypothetical protein EV702DRAFT_270554 [Suillus placidus]|uniref:Uncharacterized protein n=1 Tax=Suillus placidus TaxID=48579 RepID=A0A9P6ZVI2_9AGAM|nr:hypothetical protein EV702DRAFT_270554 [Suillus placidus]
MVGAFKYLFSPFNASDLHYQDYYWVRHTSVRLMRVFEPTRSPCDIMDQIQYSQLHNFLCASFRYSFPSLSLMLYLPTNDNSFFSDRFLPYKIRTLCFATCYHYCARPSLPIFSLRFRECETFPCRFDSKWFHHSSHGCSTFNSLTSVKSVNIKSVNRLSSAIGMLRMLSYGPSSDVDCPPMSLAVVTASSSEGMRILAHCMLHM